MSWLPPTRKSRLALPDNPLVTCGCGREVNADMLRHVEPLPIAVRGDRTEMCDACCDTLFREKRITREEWCLAFGAPLPTIAKARGIDTRLAAAVVP